MDYLKLIAVLLLAIGVSNITLYISSGFGCGCFNSILRCFVTCKVYIQMNKSSYRSAQPGCLDSAYRLEYNPPIVSLF